MINLLREKLKDWNQGFDLLGEPLRLICFLLLALPGVALITAFHGNVAWVTGMLYLVVLLGIRVAYIEGKL